MCANERNLLLPSCYTFGLVSLIWRVSIEGATDVREGALSWVELRPGRITVRLFTTLPDLRSLKCNEQQGDSRVENNKRNSENRSLFQHWEFVKVSPKTKNAFLLVWFDLSSGAHPGGWTGSGGERRWELMLDCSSIIVHTQPSDPRVGVHLLIHHCSSSKLMLTYPFLPTKRCCVPQFL